MAYAHGDRSVFDGGLSVPPPVISAEHVGSGDIDEDVPETVYIPSERVRSREEDVTLELRRTTDGPLALVAFTSLEQLVEGCGNRQHWVAVRGHSLEDLRERSGADVIVWDAAIPIEDRRSGVEQED